MKKRLTQISILALLATAVVTAESCRKEDPPAETIGTNNNTGNTNTGNTGSGNNGSGNTGGGNTGGGGSTIAGCTDPDSPNYNANANSNDGSCQYAYVTNYEITYYPEQDNGSDWDYGFGSTTNADLKLTIKEAATGNTIFVSSEKSNQPYNSPAVWTESNSVKLKNKSYQWDLIDVDAGNPDDPICSGTFTFNPASASSSTFITNISTTSSGDTQLKITYSIH